MAAQRRCGSPSTQRLVRRKPIDRRYKNWDSRSRRVAPLPRSRVCGAIQGLHLARRNQHIVRQNLALSAIVIGTLIVAAIAGALSQPVAVLAHEISEFVVIASGLRMLRA